MSHSEYPTPEILGVPNTPRNSQIIRVILRGIKSHVCNDTPDGMMNVVRGLQRQKILPLVGIDLWVIPQLQHVLAKLGIDDSDESFESRKFNFQNPHPPALVIAGFDQFLETNEGTFLQGTSPNDRIFQALCVAMKFASGTHISFKTGTEDDFEKVINLARQSFWGTKLLKDHSVIEVIR